MNGQLNLLIISMETNAQDVLMAHWKSQQLRDILNAIVVAGVYIIHRIFHKETRTEAVPSDITN